MNLSSFIILLLFVNFIYANSYKNSNNNSNCNGTLIQSNTFKLNFKIENKINSSNINSRQNEKIQNLELDKFSGNIKIWSGWVKYFHYKSNIKFKNPKDFFVNSYFNKQKVLKNPLFGIS